MANYLVNPKSAQEGMLKKVGVSSFEELYHEIPKELIFKDELDIPSAKSELEIYRQMKTLSEKNKVYPTIFRGAGSYRHFIPSVVNHLASRAEFVTAYTPYQPEISQGTLQTIFEYQTAICELTGMEVSNASVYDGATAAGEAVLMCMARKKSSVLVSSTAHPDVIGVIQQYGNSVGFEVIIIDQKDYHLDVEHLKSLLNEEVAGVYIPQINYYGFIESFTGIKELLDEYKAKLIVSVYPIAAALLPSAFELGADIVVGEGQPLGLPLGFGGPYIGFMATTKKLMRSLPGRIVGIAPDAQGRRAFVLTLQAREQHIRREKAISSICSNQSLMATRVAIYCSTLGTTGLQKVAQANLDLAHYLQDQLSQIDGFEKVEGEFFNEFVMKTKCHPKFIEQLLDQHDILAGYPLDSQHSLWCATEMNTKAEIDQLVEILKGAELC